jgi:serine/threonine-protein kinase HipA
MPVRLQSYDWQYGIHPLFEMNIPEGHLKEELVRRFSKSMRGFDDFALLGIVGPHQLGRLSITQPTGENALPEIRLSELLVHDGARGLFDELINTYAAYSGVSGVQPKVLVRDTQDSSLGIDRLTHRGATHLVKAFNDSDFPQLAANEFFCMRAALHCGLEVPECQLSQHGKFLVIKRFGIENDTYLGFEDFCVLSGWGTRKKYDGSYQGCATLIKSYVEPSRVTKALESFFKMVALSAGIQNGDAHDLVERHLNRPGQLQLAQGTQAQESQCPHQGMACHYVQYAFEGPGGLHDVANDDWRDDLPAASGDRLK